LHETATAVEPRMERFAPAKREPADSAAESETNAPVRSAEEPNKCGTVERTSVDRTRAPTPASADECPAAIVIRREAPGRVVNPGPAPRAYPTPVAVAVGSPACFYNCGIPDVAVLGNFIPRAVIIEIRVAGNVARNVLRGNRVVFLQVAVVSPAIESVRTRSPVDGILNIAIRPGEF